MHCTRIGYEALNRCIRALNMHCTRGTEQMLSREGAQILLTPEAA